MVKSVATATALSGASVVITHRVSPVFQREYEAWLNEIGPLCRSSEGVLDWHIIRPVAGYTDTYSVMIRYQTEQHLKQWLDSPVRKTLIAKVSHLLVGEDSYQVNSGLDFLFMQGTQLPAKPPVRWKQFLLTWSAIFPLVSVLPLLVVPLLDAGGLPHSRVLHTFVVTAVVVALMVYVVMPRYTRLVWHWLHG
ncbi:antibiotic biosynthesis monooxygenase [Methylophilus sp. 5]|uniref:antibiotic biosynthesis monooxygenase n=1 Tax=Methylophilus sp. 5 TaxID=1112274 RepID=UPI0004BAD3CA|nr:antibiotic biosynthesis monooxygenase [Methylophilus sp. 5]